MRLIGVDGDVGPETIGAIRDFQKQNFGWADGRVDVGGRSFQRLVEIHNEPELVSPKTYVRGHKGRYKVTVGVDGRIIARPGDWLSKYSAAIYGDYFHIYDFGRMENGKLHLLRNPNLIRTGEVLYHIPTWRAHLGDKAGPTPRPPSMDDAKKKQISQEAVKKDFQLKGDYGVKVADAIGDALGYGAPFVEAFSFFIVALEGLATALALAAIPFQIYQMIRDFTNVSDTDLKLYGMRGAAYATTAWAFGESIPDRSPEIRRNHLDQPATPEKMQRLDEAWATAASAAVNAQEQFAKERLGPGVPADQKKIAWQAALRALGDEDKGKLSVELMKQLGEKVLKDARPQVKRIWETGFDTRYPG
jgi:hypothetical protein